jgi:hypothetical protein
MSLLVMVVLLVVVGVLAMRFGADSRDLRRPVPW